jgi:uncharacterized protein (DUF2237 family)
MTDAQIIRRLKRADKLLKKYKRLVHPVAKELAKKRSIDIFGVDGCCAGRVGCADTGVDSICMHMRGDSYRFWEYVTNESSKKGAKCFLWKWREKMEKAGIKNISIVSHVG